MLSDTDITLYDYEQNKRVQGTLHKVSGPLTRDVGSKKMKRQILWAMLLASICAGCATSRLSLTEIPITSITIYPGDTKMTEPREIKGKELEAILANSIHQDTSHGNWLELPLTIQQGKDSHKGWLRVTSTFIPVAEIVIPYGRFWNTEYDVLMLSDVNSDKLMKMLITDDK